MSIFVWLVRRRPSQIVVVVDHNTSKHITASRLIYRHPCLCCVVALGEYEPFFCRMALYDAKKQMKLTDDFHIDVNSEAVRFFMRGMYS
jgi:hypothetical protein